ncbi:MAG: glycosyltransferase family 2 protein [Planctomycetaceae bacterium]|nr:glycosyltransferase family 2 protein [Planctomycetaceae bacterium]
MSARFLTALPVFNEAAHVAPVLREVQRFSPDVLVVDDGSSDDTPRILQEIEGIRVVRHAQNAGYGAALRTAFEYTLEHGFDALVTIDCDGQHEPHRIPELVAALQLDSHDPYDIVSGSRYLQQFDGDSLPPEDRRRINFQITQQMNRCFSLNLTDTFCGFKSYRAEALSKLDITELGYAMPLQLWVQAVRHGLRITEYPVPLIYLDEKRSFGGSLDDSRRRLAYYQEVIRREMQAQSVECGATAVAGAP